MKKRTGKMISLSLAVAMAMTAAPVTAMADEPVKTDVIEAPALTPDVYKRQIHACAVIITGTQQQCQPYNDAAPNKNTDVSILENLFIVFPRRFHRHTK